MNNTHLAIIIVGILLIGVLILPRFDRSGPENTATSSAIVSDGTQVIDILVKGGYTPRNTEAKAGVPSVFRMKTAGTFDCSIALTIPSIGYKKNLPSNGVTDIPIPPQAPGTTVRGVCAMGMYDFFVTFR